MEYFKEYKQKLGKISGVENASRILQEAVFVISIGSNDFIVNYYINPYTQFQYNVSQFQDHLLHISSNFLQVYRLYFLFVCISESFVLAVFRVMVHGGYFYQNGLHGAGV